ncbi:hypothetical protein L3Q82_023407, partial [Scortum barcoo]
KDLGLNSALCDWILNFLTGRPQAVRMGSTTSSTLTLNTGAPQGCVLSPLLYSLFTHDCVATHSSNTIVKFADDTTVIGLITGDDEAAYREEVRVLTSWCQDNNLQLNVSKTKELIVDFRTGGRERNTPPSPSTGLRWRESTASGSSGFTSVRTSPGLITLTLSQSQPDSWLFFLRRLRRGSTWTQGSSAASTAAASALNREGSTEGGESCSAHHQDGACHPWRTSTPSGVGRRPPKSLRTPVTQLQTVLPAAVWPTVLQHSSPNHQAQGSFIPQTIRLLNCSQIIT